MQTQDTTTSLTDKDKLIAELTAALKAQRVLTEQLQAQIEQLLRVLYGKKSERGSNKAPATEPVSGEPSSEPGTSPSNTRDTQGRKGQAKRNTLPDTLARDVIQHELPESQRMCQWCGRCCHCIGKEVSEQFDFIPARLIVKEHRRYKYGCPNGCTVISAPLPLQPIPKGLPGPGLLADILISKYQDALPLYRQVCRFKRHGVTLAPSTLSDWVMEVADLLTPLVQLMQHDLLGAGKLHTDDTPVPVLAKGKTRQGRLWVYVADGSSSPACTIYDYSKTRSQMAPHRFLAPFRGFLQADAYPGYNSLYDTGKIIEIGCMAHTRRKFFDIANTVKGESVAKDALERIAKLYHCDNHTKNMTPNQRYYFRKKYLKIHYRQWHRWLVKQKQQTIPNTPICKAINYALNHFRASQNVLAHPACEVDNNRAERAIRPIAIGRKNDLFAGSDRAAVAAATIYSLIESAKQNGLNTFHYLNTIIEKMPAITYKNLYSLLPYHITLCSSTGE